MLQRAVVSRLKPYLGWFLSGAALVFLAAALAERWRELAAIDFDGTGWGRLLGAFALTLTAHCWSAGVWVLIFKTFGRSLPWGWGLRVYLKTNIAKYVPGNVWHFSGRIVALKGREIPLGVAIVGTLLEPLLMAAAASILACASVVLGLSVSPLVWAALLLVLAGIHPGVLNPLLARLAAAKLKKQSQTEPNSTPARLHRYPLLPLLGELGFLLWRGAGFVVALWAIAPPDWGQVPLLLSAFSVAWLLGLVLPGAPGGIGIFEATALGLLSGRVPEAALLGAIVAYRFISILAEAVAALLAVAAEKGDRQR